MGKNIAVAITSDKGLCGGINSTVCKFSRALTDTTGTEGECTAPWKAAGWHQERGRSL